MSLRTRVVAGAVLIAVALGVVLVVITQTTRSKLLDQVDGQLRAAARPIGELRLEGPPPPGGAPRRLTSLWVGYVDGDTVRTLVTPDLRAGSPPLPAMSAERAVAAAEDGEPFTTGSRGSSTDYRAFAFPDRSVGTVSVVALPIDSVDQAVSRLVAVEAVGAALILVVLALVTWWVIHLGVRPVKRMTSVAQAIAAGDMSHRVDAADPRTEAGELGEALNGMLGRIEAAFHARARSEEELRRFVADASHELRTPVATIRGYAELHRTGGLAEPGALDDAMRRTEQEAIRMGSLVDDLLLLARLDRGEGRPVAAEPVDVAALAADAASDARAVDPSRPITVADDGPLVVTGDEPRLRQVLANVVGNALVHTPAGTPITVTTGRHGDRAVIEIHDDGPGMAPEVAARAFERFYRADPARSRHRGGSGLGLSIVHAIVEAHHGTATLRSAPGGGTTVRVELPHRT